MAFGIFEICIVREPATTPGPLLLLTRDTGITHHNYTMVDNFKHLTNNTNHLEITPNTLRRTTKHLDVNIYRMAVNII